MQIGYGKQGVILGEYGCARGRIAEGDPQDGMGTLGWIEPACDNPQWILWFTPKGDGLLYTKRDPKGGVDEEPLRLKARTPLETSHQKEVKRLKDEIDQLDVQLAGCLVAADGGTNDPAKKGSYGWSPAYQAVLDLRRKYDNLVLLKQSLPKIVLE
jgi:hypothetical protein